jgi:hypothetical protein
MAHWPARKYASAQLPLLLLDGIFILAPLQPQLCWQPWLRRRWPSAL